jgi:hypothetical protein
MTTVAGVKYVVANFTDEVECWGAVLVAVIEVGGKGCIAAYFVNPVCDSYGIAQRSPLAAAAAEVLVVEVDVEVEEVLVLVLVDALLTSAGPSVPDTVKVVAKLPVMPLIENRLE